MSRMHSAGVCLAAVVALMVAPGGVHAQDGLGFRFQFGQQRTTGELGDQFDHTVDAEFSILYAFSPIRVGGGANWASFKVHDEPESWSQIRFHLLVAYPFEVTPWLRPYVEGRYTYRHLRPEGDRYFGGEEELLGDFISKGSGFQGVAGIELVLHPRLAFDMSVGAGSFSLSPDLSEEGLGPIDSSNNWDFHAGLTWFPMNNR